MIMKVCVIQCHALYRNNEAINPTMKLWYCIQRIGIPTDCLKPRFSDATSIPIILYFIKPYLKYHCKGGPQTFRHEKISQIKIIFISHIQEERHPPKSTVFIKKLHHSSILWLRGGGTYLWELASSLTKECIPVIIPFSDPKSLYNLGGILRALEQHPDNTQPCCQVGWWNAWHTAKVLSYYTHLYNHVSEIRTALCYHNRLHAKPYLGLGRYIAAFEACVFFSLQRHRDLVHEQFLPLCFWVLLFLTAGEHAKSYRSQQNFQDHLLRRQWRFLKHGGQPPPYSGVTCTVLAFS